MGTPLWEQVILSILQKQYHLNLIPGGNEIWGFRLIVVGLAYHVLSASASEIIQRVAFRQYNKKARFHDAEIFETSQNICKETDLKNFFSWIFSDHSYRSNDADKLSALAEYHLAPENYYIDKEINNAAIDFARSINKIIEWISLNFYVYPEIQKGKNTRFCLHPHWNIDRGGDPRDFDKYERVVNELSSLVDDFEKKYVKYRGLIKNKLFI